MLIVVFALLACLLGLGGVLVLWSYPGRPKPFVDVPVYFFHGVHDYTCS